MIQYYTIIMQLIIFLTVYYNKVYIYNMYTKAILLNKIRKDNNISVVRTVKSSFYMIYMYITLKIVMFLQKHVNNWCIKEIEKNLYEIDLMIKSKRIKILVKINRDPNEILFVSDDMGNDITMNVVPYTNYQCVDCTPEILGCKQIEIINIGGDTRRFCGDTSIN